MELRDEMLASLRFWLQASGIESMLCLARGHRQAPVKTGAMDVSEFAALLDMVQQLAPHCTLQRGTLEHMRVEAARPTGVPDIDSMMYM
jgi:hypothetical protein